VAERPIVQHWKCCVGATLPGVRIPPSPFFTFAGTVIDSQEFSKIISRSVFIKEFEATCVLGANDCRVEFCATFFAGWPHRLGSNLDLSATYAN